MTRKVRSQRSAGRARGKRVPRRRKPEPDDFTMIYDGRDMYLAADGVKIAKRSKGKTWISLEPGWRILDKPDSITIEYTTPKGPMTTAFDCAAWDGSAHGNSNVSRVVRTPFAPYGLPRSLRLIALIVASTDLCRSCSRSRTIISAWR